MTLTFKPTLLPTKAAKSRDRPTRTLCTPDILRSFDTLTALVVQGLGRDVLTGDLFRFVNKRRGPT